MVGVLDMHNDAGTAGPVDSAHLARYTLGNAALAREVLQLFCSQSSTYVEQLRVATSPADWNLAAHTLKGAARAIGAWKMAQLAQQLEGMQEIASLAERKAQIDELETSFQEIVVYVAGLEEERSA